MLSLIDYNIRAADGDIGTVDDFCFDDQSWVVRYLVVDTGGFLSSRKVLLSTAALGEPEWVDQTFPVKHSREEVEESPDISTERAVSRQQEADLHAYYRWLPYWGGGLGAPAAQPYPLPLTELLEAGEPGEPPKDNHLCRFREVATYGVRAVDGEIGRVEDFIVDDTQWTLKMFVVDTGHWLRGKQVLLATEWIDQVSHDEKRVVVNLKRAAIEDSPEYDPAAPVNEEFELRLYDYYGRPRQP
ncbi:MAG: PRC-barrel domain-containing protein [Candidatus Hydrogenedentes bacterium]|nr:PRC-barrel domain-containing protein [Candidatus Hydrogenedentota bacterium]